MNIERRAKFIIYTSVEDGLVSAHNESIAVIRRAIQLEEKASVPRSSLVRGLKSELRRKEREAATAPKERA